MLKTDLPPMTLYPREGNSPSGPPRLLSEMAHNADRESFIKDELRRATKYFTFAPGGK